MTEPGLPLVEEPQSLEERCSVANTCVEELALAELPTVVDDMEDSVNRAYEAWPDRLVLVDADGRVAYRGGPGPFGFEPDELEDALREELGLPPLEPEGEPGELATETVPTPEPPVTSPNRS